jgi:hypothetical protein
MFERKSIILDFIYKINNKDDKNKKKEIEYEV